MPGLLESRDVGTLHHESGVHPALLEAIATENRLDLVLHSCFCDYFVYQLSFYESEQGQKRESDHMERTEGGDERVCWIDVEARHCSMFCVERWGVAWDQSNARETRDSAAVLKLYPISQTIHKSR